MSVTLTLSNTEMSPRTSLLDVQIDRVFQETLVIQIIPRYSYHLSKCTTHTVNLAEGITQPADECMYGIRSDLTSFLLGTIVSVSCAIGKPNQGGKIDKSVPGSVGGNLHLHLTTPSVGRKPPLPLPPFHCVTLRLLSPAEMCSSELVQLAAV